MRDIKRFWLTLKNPSLYGYYVFYGLSACWTVVELSITFNLLSVPVGKIIFVFLMFLAFIVSFSMACRKQQIKIKLKNTNTLVSIKFGDIFQENGWIAVPVNEYFDSRVDNKVVSEKSLHGKLIKHELGVDGQVYFDQKIAESLAKVDSTSKPRDKGKPHKYPIGTTAALECGNKKYLPFASSEVDDQYKAHTTLPLIIKSLNGLFEKSRAECSGNPLCIPLLGTGLSGSGIPPKQIINLMLTSILTETKKREITKKINIIIWKSYEDEINLNEIEKQWK